MSAGVTPLGGLLSHASPPSGRYATSTAISVGNCTMPVTVLTTQTTYDHKDTGINTPSSIL